MDLDFMRWIGHASFVIKDGSKTIYIDPFRLDSVRDHADLILITHPHFDHLNPEDIAKIADSKTEIFVPKDSVDKIKVGKVHAVEPHGKYSSLGIKFSTIPAYNVVKERLDKHPKENKWVGYILETNNMKIYHAGDTDFINEMKDIDVDLALIPMSGTYTMDPDQAIEAAKAIKAKTVIPMHYRSVLGKEAADAAEKKFSKEVKNSRIIKEVQEPYYFS